MIGVVLWNFVSQKIFNPAGPMYDRPYITVYGKEVCPICREYQRKLDAAQQEYEYEDIDQEGVRNELYPRMEKAGLRTKAFPLPVIDVNGKLAIQPDFEDVLSDYKNSKKTFSKYAGKVENRFFDWFYKLRPSGFPQTQSAGDPLKISGINPVGGKFIAVVGGKIVQKGDKAGGYDVVTINRDFVEFRGADGKTVKRSYP